MKSKPLSQAAGISLVVLLILTACTSPSRRAARTPGATPTQPPTVTSSPEPTSATKAPRVEPTLQVSAEEHLQRGIRQQEDGNYEAASREFQAALEANPPAEIRRQALLHRGRSDLEAGDYRAAAESLARFIADYPTDPQVPAAFFWLGEARSGLGDGPGAAEAYREYLKQRPLLISEVQERIGDALAKAGDQWNAIVAYRAAADAESTAPRKARILESLAQAERALKRYDQALSAYDEILKLAQNPSYRAQIMFEAGATLHEAGRDNDAAVRWNELVATYPETTYAAQALPSLDQWGLARIDALTRARVMYGAGDYNGCLAVLRQLIRSDPEGHAGDVHYYAALSYRQLGKHADSVRELDLLINTHPQHPLVPQAWYEKGESLALLGQIDGAVATFRGLSARYPQHPRASEALWRVAQLYENTGRSWEAAAAYAQAAATYPTAGYAANARFRAGFVHYLNGRVQTAAKTWAELLPQEKDAAMRARLLLWMGKAAQRQNDSAGARNQWTLAIAASPDSFWGLRARDLLAGRRFLGQALPGAFDPARYAPKGKQSEAEAWLAGWAGEPTDGRAISELPKDVTEQAAFQRGIELWSLGEAAAAYVQLRPLQAAYRNDPHILYALALYCRDQGLYPLSISAAQRILELAPAQARDKPPRFIEELAYPTYYVHLVLQEAQTTNTDPLLFLALIRQESAFDPYATSYADARGLAQVIPSTGQYIAEQLQDSAYTPERLWRPAVSVRYGLWYLSRALNMFNDHALMALVGYNAGPGNAAKWGRLADGDDDVYFEQVSNLQPRTYMQKIYENRAHYERLYQPIG